MDEWIKQQQPLLITQWRTLQSIQWTQQCFCFLKWKEAGGPTPYRKAAAMFRISNLRPAGCPPQPQEHLAAAMTILRQTNKTWLIWLSQTEEGDASQSSPFVSHPVWRPSKHVYSILFLPARTHAHTRAHTYTRTAAGLLFRRVTH